MTTTPHQLSHQPESHNLDSMAVDRPLQEELKIIHLDFVQYKVVHGKR